MAKITLMDIMEALDSANEDDAKLAFKEWLDDHKKPVVEAVQLNEAIDDEFYDVAGEYTPDRIAANPQLDDIEDIEYVESMYDGTWQFFYHVVKIGTPTAGLVDKLNNEALLLTKRSEADLHHEEVYYEWISNLTWEEQEELTNGEHLSDYVLSQPTSPIDCTYVIGWLDVGNLDDDNEDDDEDHDDDDDIALGEGGLAVDDGEEDPTPLTAQIEIAWRAHLDLMGDEDDEGEEPNDELQWATMYKDFHASMTVEAVVVAVKAELAELQISPNSMAIYELEDAGWEEGSSGAKFDGEEEVFLLNIEQNGRMLWTVDHGLFREQ